MYIVCHYLFQITRKNNNADTVLPLFISMLYSSSKQSIVHSLIRWPLFFFFVDVHILVLQKILHCHMQIDLQTVCKHFFKINIWMLELLRYSFVNQINIQLIKCSCCISCYIDLYKVWCTLGKTKCCQNFFSCRMSNLLSPSNTRTRKWVKSFFC